MKQKSEPIKSQPTKKQQFENCIKSDATQNERDEAISLLFKQYLLKNMADIVYKNYPSFMHKIDYSNENQAYFWNRLCKKFLPEVDKNQDKNQTQKNLNELLKYVKKYAPNVLKKVFLNSYQAREENDLSKQCYNFIKNQYTKEEIERFIEEENSLKASGAQDFDDLPLEQLTAFLVSMNKNDNSWQASLEKLIELKSVKSYIHASKNPRLILPYCKTKLFSSISKQIGTAIEQDNQSSVKDAIKSLRDSTISLDGLITEVFKSLAKKKYHQIESSVNENPTEPRAKLGGIDLFNSKAAIKFIHILKDRGISDDEILKSYCRGVVFFIDPIVLFEFDQESWEKIISYLIGDSSLKEELSLLYRLKNLLEENAFENLCKEHCVQIWICDAFNKSDRGVIIKKCLDIDKDFPRGEEKSQSTLKYHKEEKKEEEKEEEKKQSDDPSSSKNKNAENIANNFPLTTEQMFKYLANRPKIKPSKIKFSLSTQSSSKVSKDKASEEKFKGYKCKEYIYLVKLADQEIYFTIERELLDRFIPVEKKHLLNAFASAVNGLTTHNEAGIKLLNSDCYELKVKFHSVGDTRFNHKVYFDDKKGHKLYIFSTDLDHQKTKKKVHDKKSDKYPIDGDIADIYNQFKFDDSIKEKYINEQIDNYSDELYWGCTMEMLGNAENISIYT